MNTADRSLAIMDYALRRRFAFYHIGPLFEHKKFKDYIEKVNTEQFTKLINAVIKLNTEISSDDLLGPEFMIGHSYFSNLDNITKEKLLDIIEYEIKPMLKEYWNDDNGQTAEQKAAELKGALDD